MRADRLARRAGVREQAQLLAHLLAAAGDRREPLVVVGQRRGRPARSPRRPSPSAGRAPRRSASSGQKRRVGRRRSASTVCISPGDLAEPAQPRRGTRPGPSASSSSASSQPSTRAARRTAAGSRASRRAGRPSTRTSRRARAMFAKPCSVRKRSISSSGLIPASSRRKTLRISSSSKTIDVFDCSAPTGARLVQLARRARRSPRPGGTRRCPPRPAASAPERIALTSSRASCGSSSPSSRARRRAARRAAGRCRARPCRSAARRARARTAARRSRSDDRVEHAARARRRATSRRTSAARVTYSMSACSSTGSLAPVLQLEPEEAARRERQQVRQLADRREARPAEHLLRDHTRRSADRSSSTACAERARLCTQRTMSSS